VSKLKILATFASFIVIVVAVVIGLTDSASSSTDTAGAPHNNYVNSSFGNDCFPDTPSRGPHIQGSGWIAGFPPRQIQQGDPFLPFSILGRRWNDGYFTGQNRMAQACISGNAIPWPAHSAAPYEDQTLNRVDNWVYPPHVQEQYSSNSRNSTAVNSFISYHRWALEKSVFCGFDGSNGGPNSQTCNNERRWVIGSAFIILMMTDDPDKNGLQSMENRTPYGGFPANNILAGIAKARDNVDNWEDMVRSYEEADLIRWSNFGQFPPHPNTTSTGHLAPASDITYFWFHRNENVYGITFLDPDNRSERLVTINKNCLNAIGLPQPLKPPFEVRSDIDPLPGGLVKPGEQYTLTVNIRNHGPATADNPTYLRVQNQNVAIANPVAPFSANMSPQNIGTGRTRDYFGGANPACNSLAAARRDPCWVWTYQPGIAGQGSRNGSGQLVDRDSVTFNFSVNAAAQHGQQACFQVYNSTSTPADNEYVGNRVCVTVNIPDKPFVSTDRGSVQAGAIWGNEPCLSTGAGSFSGDIRGRQGSEGSTGSKGDYIVSAGGNISNFRSNWTTDQGEVGTNGLTFGNTSGQGRYGQVCRPDIALNYLGDPNNPADNKAPNFAPSSFAINAATLGTGTREYTHEGNVTITGGRVERNQRITLVVNGDVYIADDITYDKTDYPSLASIPSLGIVATGNIHISNNASNLYGLYFAGSSITSTAGLDAANFRGVINTCRDGHGTALTPPAITTNASACDDALFVEGALVGNRIFFRRTAGNARGGSAAERIDFIPQLLLNPPRGTSGIAGQIRNNGERPPTF
jgi:hypothetical protein